MPLYLNDMTTLEIQPKSFPTSIPSTISRIQTTAEPGFMLSSETDNSSPGRDRGAQEAEQSRIESGLNVSTADKNISSSSRILATSRGVSGKIPKRPSGRSLFEGFGTGQHIPPFARTRTTSRRESLRQARPNLANRREEPSHKEEEYDQNLVDILDSIDPEIATLSTLTNIQNSLFVPNLGRYVNSRPKNTGHATDRLYQTAYRPKDVTYSLGSSPRNQGKNNTNTKFSPEESGKGLKSLTDEELKQRYWKHLATRVSSDDPGKYASWADIDDDDDDWAPETIEWTDGTKITLPQADEPRLSPPNKGNELGTLSQKFGKMGWKTRKGNFMAQINPTISKDNTLGEDVRNAKLLADFAKKRQRLAFGGPVSDESIHNIADDESDLSKRSAGYE